MRFATLFVVVLLALHGLTAGASTLTVPCCIANTTLLFTSTLTVSCPETTLYVSGNVSITTGISMTSANSSTHLVTSGSVSNQTSFGPAYPMTKNATETNAGNVMTTSALANITLPKINMTKTSTTGSTALSNPLRNFTLPKTNMNKNSTTGSTSLLLSYTSEGPSITKDPAPAKASPETVDVQTFPSQLGTSTTTLTKETTVTQLSTVTCTVGQPCSFRSNNGTALANSRTSPHNTAGPTGGSSGPTLNSTLDSSERGTMDTLLTSSTMTRTVTLKTSAGVFAAITTSTPGTFTPVTSSAATSLAGSSASNTEALGHGTTSTTTLKGPLVNSTSIASTSSANTSIFRGAMTNTSTVSYLIMSTSAMSSPNVSTSMANMTMASATSNGTMSFASSLLSSRSSIASPISSSTKSLTSTILSSAPTLTGSSSSAVIIIPYTKTVAISATSLASSGGHAIPPHLFTVLMHLFSYLNLASANFVSTTVQTTTIHPVKTITATPSNLGFDNAGVRPSPPFVAALLANLVPVVHGNAKRGETILSSSTTTVTLTVLNNQKNGTHTAVATSTSTSDMDLNFTAPGTSIMSIPPILDFSTAGTSIMSIPPVSGTSDSIFTSAGSMTMSMPMNSSGIIATPRRSSPGSGPTPSVSGKPAASGEAGKGGVGGLAALVGGVVVGLL